MSVCGFIKCAENQTGDEAMNFKKIIIWLWINRNKLIIHAVDWYVRTYHSNDYIHVSLIKDEIKRRIALMEDRLNEERDEQEDRKLNALAIQYKINEDGWVAEIECMEKKCAEARKIRKEVEDLRFETIRRIREMAIINARNRHEGTEIINSVGASVGRLEKVGRSISDLVKEVEDSEDKESEILQIPSTLEPVKKAES